MWQFLHFQKAKVHVFYDMTKKNFASMKLIHGGKGKLSGLEIGG